MEIDKAKMRNEYLSGDYDSFFRDAAEVTGYLLNKKICSCARGERRFTSRLFNFSLGETSFK